MSPTDKEYLEKFRNYVTGARTFLNNNKMKPERERSVCRAFLRTLGMAFKDTEVIASTNEPVDVMFREARFQVRDILESDHRRGDVWKEKQRKHETATSIDEAIETDPPPIPAPVDLNTLIPEVTTALSEKAKKYGITCQDLDMLIYLDLRKRFLAAGSAVPNVEPLKAQGWRSVSLLFPPYGVVLFAKPEAPDFLKAAEAKLHMKWFDIHTLFEPINSGS
jgi:hypothetical protein